MIEIAYIGHVLTAEGVKLDKEKLKAIADMPMPTDKKRSLKIP